MTMNPGDYPANSKRGRERPTARDDERGPNEEPKRQPVQKIVSGDVVRRKRRRRFSDIFDGGEAHGVWGHVLFEILIPAARTMVTDAGHAAIDRAIYGDRGGAPRRSRGSYNYNAPYAPPRTASPYAGRPEPRGAPRDRRSRALQDFDDIELATRVEAEEVLRQLDDFIFQFQAARVADLYDLVGIDASYTDQKYGWTDLHLARIIRTRSGNYLLDLPKPEFLE